MIIEKILNLYEEALEVYRNTSRQNNYILSYIRRRLEQSDLELIKRSFSDSINEDIYCTIFKIDLPKLCLVCNKRVLFSGFSNGYPLYCSCKCSHSTVEYREKVSLIHKGKSKSTKGKTYLEIYGENATNGFKKGLLNPNYNPVLKEKSNESLRRYYRENPEAKQIKRDLIYQRDIYFINSRQLKFKNREEQLFRSSLEVLFSEYLLDMRVNFVYEKRYRLINGKVKVVDFVINNKILVEVSGFAYKKWQIDFTDKMKILRLSTDLPIIVLTYPDKLDLLQNMIVTGDDIYLLSIYDKKRLEKTINFIESIFCLNKNLEETCL